MDKYSPEIYIRSPREEARKRIIVCAMFTVLLEEIRRQALACLPSMRLRVVLFSPNQ